MTGHERTDDTPPLRIAFVTPEPIAGGGVPGMAVTLARGLAELGHEVDCWTTAEPTRDPTWTHVEGLTLHVVRSGFRWGRWYSQGRTRPMLTNVANLGTRAGAAPRLALRLLAAHRARPYDVIYRFSTLELLGFGWLLRLLPPLVAHPEVHAAGELRWVRAEHELARRCHSAAHQRAVDLLLRHRARRQRHDIHRVAAVIAPSRRFAELLASDYGVDERRFAVVPNPVDLTRFHPGDEPREPGRVRVTFVGRAAVRKGIDVLIELSHRLDDLADDIELVIVGSASFWSDYRPLLVDMNPRLSTVKDPMTNRDVALLMAQSDLLIQPSKYEPFAITVAEALASGTPVIATDEVGAIEGVDPSCATVVPVGDLDALERAVRNRVDDVLAARDGPARAMARAEAERLFAPEVVCAAVASTLARVAASAVAGHPR